MNIYLEGAGIPAIVFMVYGVIELLKLVFEDREDIKRYYPLISGILGIVCAIVLYIGDPGIIGTNNYISTAFVGLCSGLSATGTNQLVRKIIQKGVNDTKENSNENGDNYNMSTLTDFNITGIDQKESEIYNPDPYDNDELYFEDEEDERSEESQNHNNCFNCDSDCCMSCEYNEHPFRYYAHTNDSDKDGKKSFDDISAKSTLVGDEYYNEAECDDVDDTDDIEEPYDYSEDDNASDLIPQDD